jgi:hypothetical protein
MQRVRQPAGLEQPLNLGDFLCDRGAASADLETRKSGRMKVLSEAKQTHRNQAKVDVARRWRGHVGVIGSAHVLFLRDRQPPEALVVDALDESCLGELGRVWQLEAAMLGEISERHLRYELTRRCVQESKRLREQMAWGRGTV